MSLHARSRCDREDLMEGSYQVHGSSICTKTLYYSNNFPNVGLNILGSRWAFLYQIRLWRVQMLFCTEVQGP